jgi:pilus assembly protein Flp/PilA
MGIIQNQKGQGLIEYLVLVCLIAVGSMAVIRVVGKNVRVQFANISRALGGQDEALQADKVSADDYSKRDFSDFMKGAGSGTGGSNNPGSDKGSGRSTNKTMPDFLRNQ